MYDMIALNDLLYDFQAIGYTIGVISWSAKGGSTWYNAATKKVKQAWLKKYLPCVTEVHVVRYGTSKQSVARIKNGILIDDNEQVRSKWKGKTIDANKNILEELEKLLASELQ